MIKMVIGLTGSIACGKSLISRYLKNKGYNLREKSHCILASPKSNILTTY